MTNVEPLTFDSWDDAVEAGCTGYVKIGGVEQKINFAALGWSENSHFLTMKELQISVRDSSYPHITCDAGSGHVLREGYLTDEDLGLWQTVDVPLESIDELEFDWSETEESLEWVSGPQSGIAGQAVGGRQVPYLDRCFIFIVGYSLYWVPRSEP